MASIDLLSSLPDDVIFNILSFLPTKLSVATSVLGKKWRFLWPHVPSLHFDFTKEGKKASDVINTVILQHKAKRMDTLTLDSLNCKYQYQLETIITTAINRSIRNLYLQLEFDNFPRSLFNCKTIVDLKLAVAYPRRVSLSTMDNVSLPSLKKFQVFRVVCENDDALPHFLSSCPSLEELIMEFAFCEKDDYVGCINISSPTIKMLQLSPWVFQGTVEYRMIINSPALRYLQVYEYNLEYITIAIPMISLVEADINLQYYCFSKHKTNYNSTVVKFLHSLSYVKCLKLSGWEFVEFIHRGVACSTVRYDNLTKLEVELWKSKWGLLVKFLEVADNLQVLIVSGEFFIISWVDYKEYLCPEPEQVPKCLLSCLRTITFKLMRFKEHDFDMVRYLLRNSRVWERMEIFTAPRIDLETKFEALKRISLFERGSSACQLALLSDC